MADTAGTNGQTGAGPEAAPAATPEAAKAPEPARGPERVRFDTSEVKSDYCNVCNGSSTREEVVLNFGVNSTWDQGRDQLEVKLLHRIVMSPHAAKRVRDMMVRLIEEHEARYGKLSG